MRRAAALVLTAVCSTVLVAGCGTPTAPTPAAVAPQLPAASAAPAAPVAPTAVTLPNVVGQNGAIAQDTLRGLGLTKVELAADAKSGKQVVISPANWTVTKLEPKAGTQVRPDQTVVVTMTK